MIKSYVITRSETVKEYITATLHLSLAQIKRLKLLHDGICVNDEHVTVRRLMQTGDVLSLNFTDSTSSQHVTPEKLHFDIIFEDDDLLVVNKPSGMSTHPTQNNYSTLANGVLHMHAERGIPFVFRAVNRLDKSTSGLVVIAKNSHSANMYQQFITGAVSRGYTGIVEGSPPDMCGTVSKPIARVDGSSILRRVDENGKRAVTHYEVVSKSDKYSLLRFTLETGRTHQIRVHMAYLGCPIAGDYLYGTESDNFPNGALHCSHISFIHPVTGTAVEYSCKPPEYFSAAFGCFKIT